MKIYTNLALAFVIWLLAGLLLHSTSLFGESKIFPFILSGIFMGIFYHRQYLSQKRRKFAAKFSKVRNLLLWSTAVPTFLTARFVDELPLGKAAAITAVLVLVALAIWPFMAKFYFAIIGKILPCADCEKR